MTLLSGWAPSGGQSVDKIAGQSLALQSAPPVQITKSRKAPDDSMVGCVRVTIESLATADTPAMIGSTAGLKSRGALPACVKIRDPRPGGVIGTGRRRPIAA